MDAIEVLMTTRAIRRFSDRPVSDADIETCLRAAQQAPSGGNVQPQQYVVVTDPEVKAALGILYQRAYHRYEQALPGEAAFDDEAKAAAWRRTRDASRHLADHLGDVPAIVLFLQPIIPWGADDEQGHMDIGRLDASVYPAVQNFCVAARALGLGTALTTVVRIHAAEVFELLGVPMRADGSPRFEIAALVPVGHPQGNFGVAPRKPAAAVTHWNAWGTKRVALECGHPTRWGAGGCGSMAVMSTTADRLTFDLLDPYLYQDSERMHSAFTWMRANEPVYRDHRNGLWGITRHADLQEVERRSSVFASGQGYRAIWAPDEINMIAQDDPRHRQQRMLVQGDLTGAAIAARRPEIEALVTELLDAAVPSSQMEVVDALSGQLPARLTCRLLGYPESMWREVKSWSERLMRIDMRERDGRTFTDFIDANMEFVQALMPIAQERAKCPAHDFISTWVHAEIEGERLPPAAIVHEVGLFISGGAETTRTAISHGLRAFVDHPDQWEAMAAEPSLVPGAVEEVLRWVTPLNNMFRRAVADDEVGGQAIRRGDRIIMLYPSANRDESVFDNPFTFDIRRSPNPQIAFGFGTHLCVGTHVARTTLAAVFTQLSQRITNLRVVAEPDVEPNIFARAVRSFGLAFEVR